MAPLSKQEQFFVPECEKEVVNEPHTQTIIDDSQSFLEEDRMSRGASQLTETQLNATQNTSILSDSESENILQKDDQESRQKNGKNNDMDLTVDGNQTLSDDDSTSSFELVKKEQLEK